MDRILFIIIAILLYCSTSLGIVIAMIKHSKLYDSIISAINVTKIHKREITGAVIVFAPISFPILILLEVSQLAYYVTREVLEVLEVFSS